MVIWPMLNLFRVLLPKFIWCCWRLDHARRGLARRLHVSNVLEGTLMVASSEKLARFLLPYSRDVDMTCVMRSKFFQGDML